MEIKFFVFSVEIFQFFKLYGKEAKPDKPNFIKRDLTMEFDIKNSLLKSYWKIGFQFWKVTFLGVSDQANCKFALIQPNTKISVGIKFGKGLLTSSALDSLNSMFQCR